MQYDQGSGSFSYDLLTLLFRNCSLYYPASFFETLSLLSAAPGMTFLFMATLGHVSIFGPITAILKMPCTHWLN